MSSPLERYQNLGLRESLPKIYRYPFACKELSFILREAYNKLPKNLQAIVFQDTLTAFRLLPEVQTSSAVSSTHILLQSVEAALPKQKKSLAVTEFKHAMVAHKRRLKTRREGNGSAQLPHDALVHIFSFLDMQSLISMGLVCWSWNLAASDNHLWESQYTTFFGNSDNNMKKQFTILAEDEYWKATFRRAYTGSSGKRLTSSRGYCRHCKSIVWIDNMKCPNSHSGKISRIQDIKPLDAWQVVEYLLDDSLFVISSSDSDTDSDGEPVSRLWAYPKHMKRS
ncbi:F-box protein [Quillaja saponaria]|uniref:F-box protein n=1 Tax=Quillaja saponaria TaxID=32244 RepID=A0AAD7Q398_QUISA|nr:F-box protein [Quillaja saponaria]